MKLLINEYPLMVLPSLATKIGLEEAMVLQQIHYWLEQDGKIIDGRKWTYNTYAGWKKQFPFWSERTIQRIILRLEKQGLLLTGNFNRLKIDKTKWYSINYDSPVLSTDVIPVVPESSDGSANFSPPLPETSSYTSPDNPPISPQGEVAKGNIKNKNPKKRKSPDYSPEFLAVYEPDKYAFVMGRAFTNWKNLLEEGFTPEQLAESRKNYLKWAKDSGKAEYTIHLENFYGKDRAFERFLRPVEPLPVAKPAPNYPPHILSQLPRRPGPGEKVISSYRPESGEVLKVVPFDFVCGEGQQEVVF